MAVITDRIRVAYKQDYDSSNKRSSNHIFFEFSSGYCLGD